jgi:DNA-binding NarL/FixJ family response regulator
MRLPATEFIQLVGEVEPSVPVIVVTGTSNRAEHERFITAGAKCVIEKSANFDAFTANLASIRDYLPIKAMPQSLPPR